MLSIKIKQRDITDCGAACLASISAHYQRKISVALIRKLSSTNQRGATILGLVEGARRLGFEANGFRGTIQSLETIPLPAIAHIQNGNGTHHYVVVFAVNKMAITIMDPAEGELLTVTADEFYRMWTGVLVLLSVDAHFKNEVRHISRSKRLINLIWPHKEKLILVISATVLYTLIVFQTR